MKKRTSRSYRDMTLDHVIVESWRENRSTEKVYISGSDYEKIKKNETRIMVAVRSGRFGFPWIASYRIEKKP